MPAGRERPGPARELRVGATQPKASPNLAWERSGGTDGARGGRQLRRYG
jgi:hypothetical protein